MKNVLARFLCPLVLLAGLAALGGCAISEDEEVAMGLDAAPKFEQQFGGLHPNRALQDYVQEIGMRMARQTGRTDLPWSFQVLDSREINAFALPGGQIYITHGLLRRLENEAQLAAILGHEAGHVANRDSVNQIQRTQVAAGGAALAGLVGGSDVGDISQIAASLALMRYSRDQERNADRTGLDYLAREGYDPHAMIDALDVIKRSSEGKGKGPEFLSTHPRTEGREDELRDYIRERYGNVVSAGRTDDRRFDRMVRRAR